MPPGLETESVLERRERVIPDAFPRPFLRVAIQFQPDAVLFEFIQYRLISADVEVSPTLTSLFLVVYEIFLELRLCFFIS